MRGADCILPKKFIVITKRRSVRKGTVQNLKKRLSRYNPTSENILQNEKNRKNIGNGLNELNGITVCGTNT